VKTRVGYCGGRTPNPTYESVCDGDGHTEAMRVWYDPSRISYERLLEVRRCWPPSLVAPLPTPRLPPPPPRSLSHADIYRRASSAPSSDAQIFFREHDPTRKAKPQYCSAVWYSTPEQQAAVRAAIADLEARFPKMKIATRVEKEAPWTDAEEYHQMYLGRF